MESNSRPPTLGEKIFGTLLFPVLSTLAIPVIIVGAVVSTVVGVSKEVESAHERKEKE